jgi:hypothetical protein|tara:strand:+ start:447 stop:662 length:216 start_codon:yes stop_codon:yes gene_type:complete
MGFTDLPAKYYEKEKFISLMGIGYTAALAVTGLGGFKVITASGTDRLAAIAILGGGALATWGYLKSSGVLY